MERTFNFKSLLNKSILLISICFLIQQESCFKIEDHKYLISSINSIENSIHSVELDFNAQTVNFCKKYDENFNCLYCIRDYYIRENVCTRIEFASLIANCNIYTNPTTCLQCDDGFFLAGNALCSRGDAGRNCLAFQTETNCRSCKTGFRLEGNNCVVISGASSLPNCAVSRTASKCDVCLVGFALSEDEVSCVSVAGIADQVDPNCEDLAINSGKFCNLCREGFFLRNGQCEQTDSTDSCFLPNPDSPSECHFCFSGFSMKTRGKCLKNENVISGQVDPVRAFASQLRSMVAFLLCSLLISHS